MVYNLIKILNILQLSKSITVWRRDICRFFFLYLQKFALKSKKFSFLSTDRKHVVNISIDYTDFVSSEKFCNKKHKNCNYPLKIDQRACNKPL